VHDVDHPGASTSTVEGGPTERLCCPVNGPFPSWVSGSAYTIVPASTGTLFGSKRLLGDLKASTPSDDVLLWYFAGAELFAETIGSAVSVERYCPIVRCPDLPAKLQFASEPQVVGLATGQPEPFGIAI
jgi:hypothetical protein